jgi:hypothetical protein
MTHREQLAELKAEIAELRDKIAELQAAQSGVHYHYHYAPVQPMFPQPLPWSPTVIQSPQPSVCSGDQSSQTTPGWPGEVAVWN